MTKKFKKTYIYEGLGFPIKLHNIEMVLVDGEYAPKIDIRKIAKNTIQNLILEKNKLTGNHIKFIRAYFSLSLREFSKIVNESHTAVRKWESFHNTPTNMDPNIEKTIRVFICDNILFKNKADKSDFYNQYHAITQAVAKQKPRQLPHVEA